MRRFSIPMVLAVIAALSSPAAHANTHADTQPASAAPDHMREAVEERNKRVIGDAFARWAAGGTGFFEEVLAPNAAWTIAGSGTAAGTYRGLADFMERAVRPFAERLSSPVRPVVHGLWADGDHVIVHWDGTATARDGQPYRNSYAWIFRLRDGKAVEVTAYLDLPAYDDVIRRIP
ncbi:nuclear transport factor 2 family protein [Arenibaculum pallidiluteum]|uniref:nuclear transport factor 2 family protein n=1 Tax=Arenibaculum pallidiluteum TaxID=2812559 RepID=UPI001A956D5B|nr:nuclear transport factor 2 family protein [Arenibaculum pallidiluteum]